MHAGGFAAAGFLASYLVVLPEAPLFPSSGGGTLSTDAVERLVEKHAKAAGGRCPSIVEKNVTPHVLRHSAGMALRDQGVDLSVIALWLGHELVETTQMYLHADIHMKEKALARTAPIEGEARRFQVEDALTAYLESLWLFRVDQQQGPEILRLGRRTRHNATRGIIE